MNIMLIVVDALRADKLGCYGSKNYTPHIDTLAKQGLLFENCFCCSNHTDPSFTTILLGKYPHVHGIKKHGLDILKEAIGNVMIYKSLPEILKNRGYYTIGISWLGRWHKKGFDRYLYPSFGSNKFKKIEQIKRFFAPVLKKIPLNLSKKTQKIGRNLQLTDEKPSARELTNLAIKEIKRSNDKFFMLLHYVDTHYPIITPTSIRKGEKVNKLIKRCKDKSWVEAISRSHLKNIKYTEEIHDRYNSAVELVDYNVGRIISYLKSRKIYKNTLIIITSDHGNDIIRDKKFVSHQGLYDPVIKVPLIISAPKLISERFKGFIQHADIFSILINYLDKYNKHSEKINLIKNIKKRKFILCQDAMSSRLCIRDSKYKLIINLNKTEELGINDRALCELYNLSEDPLETRNLKIESLISKYSEKALQFIKKLNDENSSSRRWG